MTSCETDSSGCSTVLIIQSAAKSFFARLFYRLTGEPYDLTGVTEIIALLPGSDGSPVAKTLTNSGGVTVVGSAGAGKIQIALTTLDTGNLQPSPQIPQNLQVIVTLNGVAQEDTLSMGSPPIVGTLYAVTLNGQMFGYKAQAGDTAQTVFTALAAQIVIATAAGLPISAVESGSGSEGTLVLTSTVPALAFTDVVSAGITLSNTITNSGERDIVLLQQALNIQPQDYVGY
jgi:hypothetical protein